MPTVETPEAIVFGTPPSAFNPLRRRAMQLWMEAIQLAASTGIVSIEDDLSNLPAASTVEAGVHAIVLNDAEIANRGMYKESSDVWVKTAELPPGLVATDPVILTAGGTGDAVTAVANRAFQSAPLAETFTMEVAAANTGEVTLAIEGGESYPVLTNSGGVLAAGYLAVGAVVDFRFDGSAYRMTSTVSDAAIQSAAAESASQSEAWAATAEDTEVEPGAYSARHHAAKAAASAVVASSGATTATEQAALSLSAAQASGHPVFSSVGDGVAAVAEGELFTVPTDIGARVWRKTGGVEDHHSWLTGPKFPSVSGLLQDTSSGFGPPGQIVRAGRYRLEVVASGGDISTSGGVLLEVLPTANGYEVEAFGTDADANAAFAAWKAKCEAIGGDFYIGESHTITDEFVMTNTAEFTRVTFGNGAILTTDGTNDKALAFNSESTTGHTLSSDEARGTLTVTLTDATGFTAGDLVHIRDTSVNVESTFSSDAQEVNLISEVSGNDVTFEKPLTFPYTSAGTEIENYGQRTLELINYRVRGNRARGAGITGFKYPRVVGFDYEQTNRALQDGGEDGIYAQRNWKLHIKGFKVMFAQYGIQDNASFGTVIEDVDAYDCRHPVDPNALSQNTLVKNMTARNCNSAINSHAALDVVYDGFVIEEDRGRPLVRGTGGAVKNGVANYVGNVSAGEHCLITWTPGFEYMMNRTFVIENVTETFPNNTSAVFATTFKNINRVQLKNYRCPGVAPGDHENVEELFTEDCAFAYYRGGATVNSFHRNLLFDRSLNANGPTVCWSNDGSGQAGIAPNVTMIGTRVLGDYTYFNLNDAAANAAITGASGDGSTATLTFAAMAEPFEVGSRIIVEGMDPAGYDGIHRVTASTTTSVSFANTETGALVSGGDVQAYVLRNFDTCDLRGTGQIFWSFSGMPIPTHRIVNTDLSKPVASQITSSSQYVSANNRTLA